MMVRFFCEEMGIYLPKGKNDVEESRSWSSRFGSSRLSKAALRADLNKYGELCEVLRAANRAVAHIDDGDVDHSFRTDSDDERIFRVIDWMEDLIDTHIYQAAGRDFGRSMLLPNNVMQSRA